MSPPNRLDLAFKRGYLARNDRAERVDVDTLAVQLAATGGLGHFVGDLFPMWNNLTEHDRLAAATGWQLACVTCEGEIAA